MPMAALPDYLRRQDLTQASPGLRFGMYLPLWGVRGGTGDPLWTTHDVNERIAGQQRQLREFKDENKTGALKQALELRNAHVETMCALASRQSALASPLASQGRLLTIHARAISPFTTGLGNEHPLENGFAFLNPYGLPYLPGSGVKGVLRKAACELASGDWGDSRGWHQTAIDALFGKAPDRNDEGGWRGALICWDVLPQLAGNTLQVEVMTPHQGHYYQKVRETRSGSSDSPHESGQPTPINFLTVPPGSAFDFHLQCDRPLLERSAPELVENNQWQALLVAALEHAFAWLGFGAKTAVGYGAMEDNPARAREIERQREAHRRQQEEQAEEQRRKREAEEKALAREAAKAAMSPADRAMAEYFDGCRDANQSERTVLFNALKKGELAEHRVAVAERIARLMKADKVWREKSEKKNPEKDHPHQDTLQVMKWLKS